MDDIKAEDRNQHVETTNRHSPQYDSASDVTGFEADETTLKPGYFRSSFFLGSMTAICLGLFAGVSGFAYAAPILTLINNDIGPDPNIAWVALVYTLTSAVCITLVGRISDIFGRRYMFIGGALVALVGSIVCSRAMSVPELIGGMTLIGIGASTQLSYYFVMGELVPMRYRLAGNAAVYVSQIPGSGIAPVVATAFVKYQPAVGWRGCYYLLIAVNAVALACWVFFYFPPNFHMKHGNAKIFDYIRKFDYVGTILYTGGLLILLMGLNWGGQLYAWNSSHVVATIVVGAVSLIVFVLWETFMKLEEPLVPMYVFDNRGWICATLISGIGASMYYAFAIVWPSAVNILYADATSPIGAAWMSSIVGLLIVIGEIVGGFAAKTIMHIKWQITVSVFLGGLFFACVATCGPDDKNRACAFVALGVFFVGWAESLAITTLTLTAKRQDELGTASGIAGAIRFLIASIASTIYTVILNNELAKKVAPRVTSAVEAAGLPSSSAAQFIQALSLGSTSLNDIPGVNSNIITTGRDAYKNANASAYHTVFLTTLAFSGICVICALLLPNVDHLLTNKIATTLRRDEKSEVKDVA
ncbi:uncharacterized protein PV09_05715 [Verruconis gallopava]|uniref:Major facilitator superfamily (MFS) profile domain-containing protein n=1 Tax=Verruconis gallopava TaxID=253628 RepID=A0A0D1XL35_9PEZI|nr:uncharacterized protein PV09_05715 [Verruconis gallopava]KIW03066.1 hypothetical protein PV09_05715 [Verruconis gallopava]